MNLRWFTSGTVRHAAAMCKHVRKLLNHQRDFLAPNAIKEVESAIAETESIAKSNADKATLTAQMEKLETAANKWLKPYPNATIRENIEVLLVALAVAMAVRTFFLQPFKIPTGSMQPTLFGVTSQNLSPDAIEKFFVAASAVSSPATTRSTPLRSWLRSVWSP